MLPSNAVTALKRTPLYDFCLCLLQHAIYALQSAGYGKSVDFWALGVLLYEMMAGRTPFNHIDDERMYRNIVKGKYSCPFGFSGELINLLRHMINTDVTKRYGNLVNGVRDIKNHKWLQSIDWCALFSMQVPPPFLPTVTDTEDTRNFELLKARIFVESSQDRYEDEFKDF